MMWKIHPTYINYEVSDLGDIRHVKTLKVRKPRNDKNDYLRINIYHNSKLVTVQIHRMVIEAFVGPREDLTVNHIDGNKLNNSVNNLELITGADNVRHAYRLQLNHKQIPVEINGVIYFSKREAERITGIRRYKL